MESPRRITPDGVVDSLRDRDLDTAAQRIILLDFQRADLDTVVVDRCRDITVDEVEDLAGGPYRDMERARHHAGVQLDVRCACGLWFHSTARFKIIARNARRQFSSSNGYEDDGPP